MTKQSRAVGWWEQMGFGRQEMEGLLVQIEGGSIQGSGYDIVGAFLLEGHINEDGSLRMNKSYLDKHSLVYQGEFDGKNHLWGVWSIFGMTGPWEIQLGRQMKEKESMEQSEVEVQLH